jgi:hypothetical protein
MPRARGGPGAHAERPAAALGVGAPDLPPVGEYQRGGGIWPFMECQASPDQPANVDPEANAACQALLKRRKDEVAQHERRFERLYRIDREGVRVQRGDGSLAPVEGARAAVRATPERATLEASIPLLALPRMSAAPVESLALVARVASAAPPPPPDGGWTWVALPAPVAFEPFGDIRGALFQQAMQYGIYRVAASYQPGVPSRIEIIGYPGPMATRSLMAREGDIYVKQASLGDVCYRARSLSLLLLRSLRLRDAHLGRSSTDRRRCPSRRERRGESLREEVVFARALS